MLTKDEVNEIADAPAGVVSDTVRNLTGGVGAQKIESKRMGVEGAMSSAAQAPSSGSLPSSQVASQSQPKLEVKSVSGDGKVTFEAKKEP